MNKLGLLITLLLSALIHTEARCDRFIYKGDTLYFETKSLLEQYPYIEDLRKGLVGYDSGMCYDCYQHPYIAEWTVINDIIYLTGIYSDSHKNLKANIDSLFNVHDGKVRANWVTDSLWIPHGKPINSGDVMISCYTGELNIFIANGKVTTVKKFNYANAGASIYSRNADSLKYFIATHINWKKIPYLGVETKRVIVNFIAGTEQSEDVKVVRGPDEPILKEEAVRVVELMPWMILYLHGKPYRQSWTLPVLFSEADRKKYSH